MKFFQRIWNDIRQGQNIDLYLTILIALPLTILNIFGLASNTWLAPITLAVLALLAISNLENRHKLDLVLERETTGSFLHEEYPPSLQEDLTKADELWLIGQNLGRTVVNLLPILETKLAKGDRIKVLVISPDGMANKFATARLYLSILNEQQHRERILSTLSTFSKLGKPKRSQLEVKTVDYPIPFGAIAINPDTPNGTIYIEYYGFKLRDDIPKMVLKPKDSVWYGVYKGQIDELWKVAEVWDFSLT